MDKNVRPRQFSELKNELNYIKEKLKQENILIKIVGLIPDCMLSKYDNPDYQFSYNYLLQTYLRISNREDHPTIVQNEWHLKPAQISLFFFKQFENVEFRENKDNCIWIDHKWNYQLEFDEFLYLPFTYESTVFSPPQSFIECADAVLNSSSNIEPWKDETLLQQFYNWVEFYRDIFSFKEAKYSRNVKSILSLIDIKEPLIKIVRRKSKWYENIHGTALCQKIRK